MRVSLTPLLSQLRLARRGTDSRRFYTVSALNPTEQHQVNHLKVCNFDSNLSQAGVLRVLKNTSDDPELAFSFLSQLKRNGIPLNVNAYATVVKILSIWGLDIKLDSVLVELIGNEKRSFCVLDLIAAIGEEAGEKKRSLLLIRVSSALVKAYVGLGMFDEAIDVLFQCHRLGCVPCIKACNFLMNRMIEGGKIDMVVALFRQLKPLGLCPNRYTYAIVVKALCRKGDLEAAAKLLCESPSAFGYTAIIEGLCVKERTGDAVALIRDLVDMKALAGDDLRIACSTVVRGFCNEMNIEAAERVAFEMEKLWSISPDVNACLAIIDRHCKNMDLSKALGFLDIMFEKGLKINCVIVTLILQGYCKMEKYLEALQKFKEYRDTKIFLDKVCYNVAFDALGKLGRVEEASELLQEMMDKGMLPDVINYTTLIEGYCLQGKFVDALDLVDKMRENGTSPDVIMYNVLAGGLARNGHTEYALDIYRAMKAEGLEPSAVTHSVIIEGLCFARKIEEAEKFFVSLENKCPEDFASLVKGYCESGLSNEAFKLFADIENPLRKSVYFKLFTSLCNDGYSRCNDRYLYKAFAVLKRMWVYGVEPGRSMYGKLIGGFCGLNNVSEARVVFDTMGKRGLVPDLFTYTIMIHTYCRRNELQKAHALFEDMKERKIKPDVVTYTVLIDGHLKLDPVLENKLSEVLEEFTDSGIGLDVVCYTVFIDRQCKIHNLKAAEELFDQMINSGLKPDMVTYTSLLSGFCRKGHIDKAVALATEWSTKDIAPTGHFEGVVTRATLKAKRFQLR